MIYNVIMPKAGMAMEEGTVLRWVKNVGDKVSIGDELLEIETDKVNMMVEADAEGYLLKILNGPGDVVPVVQTIGYIGDTMDEAIPGDAAPAAAAAPAPAAAPAAAEAPAAEAPAAEDTAVYDYDVIVVGGGPAGYISAIQAARLGGKVAVVEKDAVGGTCLNRGCIPTKTYLESAKLLKHIAEGKKLGVNISADAVSFDMAAALKNKNRVVKKLTGGVGALLKGNKIDLLNGVGVIKADKTVEVDGKSYSAKSVIFAGGSVPTKLPIPGADNAKVLDSTAMLDMDNVPGRLVIIGGGVIGVELACAFHGFGSKVTVIEFLDNIIANMDEDLSATLKKALTASGIDIHTSTKCEEIAENADGSLTVRTSGGSFEADYVLVATGRKPDLSGVEGLDIAIERGAVVVDDKMQTSIPGIYAPGDANARLMLAHSAFKMGEVAAKNAMGIDCEYDGKVVPACIYTFPEVASVGLTEKAAAEKGKVVTGKFNFAANGRALAMNATDGFIKVVADADTHEILGVHMIGPSATEMINEAAVILHMEMDAEEVSEVIHAHPTCSEALLEACEDCIGASFHSL